MFILVLSAAWKTLLALNRVKSQNLLPFFRHSWVLRMYCFRLGFFFFQAEDGIRDIGVTGVQTCALPILGSSFTDFLATAAPDLLPGRRPVPQIPVGNVTPHGTTIVSVTYDGGVLMGGDRRATMGNRSEERRVGKEGRSRWAPHYLKKKRM